ncbi:MAG TPA: hypothetical protein VFD57_00200 [Clostridia bacterium]|nr:hypothetical protein [Clostridia bacterium]
MFKLTKGLRILIKVIRLLDYGDRVDLISNYLCRRQKYELQLS